MTYQELCKQINLFTEKHGKPYKRNWYSSNTVGRVQLSSGVTKINPIYAYMDSSNLSTMRKYICISGQSNGTCFHCLIKNDTQMPKDIVKDYGFYYNNQHLLVPKENSSYKMYECCTSSTPIVIQSMCTYYALTPISKRQLPNRFCIEHVPYPVVHTHIKVITPIHSICHAIKRIWNREVK